MIRIITDSAADLEPWEYEKYQVSCIPLTVMFGDTEYQENVNLSKDQFYDLLTTTGEYPKTAQPSPQILLDLFEQAKAAGDEAIYITLSSALSGTWQSAVAVLDMAEFDGGFVVDSRNATGGQRLLVEEAVRLRDAGKTAQQIVAALEAFRDRVVLYACIDTLEYLYRGGRISRASYAVGSIAQIKPIISVDILGSVATPAKAMGMRKGMDFLCKQIQARTPDQTHPFYVMYTANRANGEVLAQRIRDMGIPVPDERIINVGAAIGAHIGPNGCGIVYVGPKIEA